MFIRCRICLVIACALSVSHVSAETDRQPTAIRSFFVTNLNPLDGLHGIPSLENAPLSRPGNSRIEIQQDVANFFSSSGSAGEVLITDGETWRTSANLAYAPADNWQVSVYLPYLKHSKGFMDDIIYDWHDWFGLPQGGRTNANANQFRIFYRKAGHTIIDKSYAESGIGDIRAAVHYQSQQSEFSKLVGFAEIKLPTGDFDKLTGSETTDVTFGLVFHQNNAFGRGDMQYWAGGAISYLPNQDDLDNNNWLGTARLGFGWQAFNRASLLLQMDGHTAVYDSELTETGNMSVQLSVGSNIRLSDETSLDFGFSEDLAVDTAPDVVFFLRLQYFRE